MISRAEAAERRAAGVRQRADRPSQRRCAPDLGSLSVARVPLSRCEVREASDGSGRLEFSGQASAYERGYDMWDLYGEYTEVVEQGAGAVSLARADLDVPLVLDHRSIRRIARTGNTASPLILSESGGLDVLAPSLDPDDMDVRYIAPKIRSGLITEMSFKFAIIRGQWSPDYTEYRIQEYDIHRGDVAIVGYGANPYTSAELRSPGAGVDRARLRALAAL